MKKKPNLTGFNVSYRLAAIISEVFEFEYGDEIFNKYFWFYDVDSQSYFQELVKEHFSNLQKPAKETLLHIVAEDFLNAFLKHESYWFMDDYYNWEPIEIINFLERTFISKLKHYEVLKEAELGRVNDFFTEIQNAESLEDWDENHQNEMYDFLGEIFDWFEKVAEFIVDEVFFLLFHNKRFLYSFSERNAVFYNQVIQVERFTRIERVKYIPSWLKRSVFYRDRGVCQGCYTSLTNLDMLLEDGELHFDHVFPLKKGGSNDPTNFQLMCKDCNQTKGTTLQKPKHGFISFWSRDEN